MLSPHPLTPSPALPLLAFRSVTRQTGYIAVEAANDQEVAQQAENLREVDPADVPGVFGYQPGRVVAAYQYQRLPYRLQLSAERRQAQEVLAAVCPHATITSVVSREGIIRHQVNYSLRSLGVQHLTVQLPAGANLWSATLDSAPVEVRRTSGQHIIPLPAGGGPNRATGEHEVELVYETSVGNALRGVPTADSDGKIEGRNGTEAVPYRTDSGGLNRLLPQTIRQAAPVVNMTVLELTWNVHLPNGTVLVSSDGDFKPTVEPTRPSLVARLRDAIAENSIQDIGMKLILLACALAASVVVWMLAQSRGILAAILVVAIVGVLIAITLPTVQQAREAARYTESRNNLKQIGMAMKNYKADTAVNAPTSSATPAPMEAANERLFHRDEADRQHAESARRIAEQNQEQAEEAAGRARDELAKGKGMAKNAARGPGQPPPAKKTMEDMMKGSRGAMGGAGGMPGGVPAAAGDTEAMGGRRGAAGVTELGDGSVRFHAETPPAGNEPEPVGPGRDRLAKSRSKHAGGAGDLQGRDEDYDYRLANGAVPSTPIFAERNSP